MSEQIRLDWIEKVVLRKRNLDEYKRSNFETPRIIPMDIEEEYDSGYADGMIDRFLVEVSFELLNQEEYEKFLERCPLKDREKGVVQNYWSLNRLFYELGKSVKDEGELEKKVQEKSIELFGKKRDGRGAGDIQDWYVNELYKGAKHIAYIGLKMTNR